MSRSLSRCCSMQLAQVTKSSSRMMSTNSPYQDDTDRRFYPVYVHHLSKVALEHLQNEHADWIVQNKLETGLRLNPDGTFVIHFPSRNGRIWTSYDGETKQHWLSVYKERLVGRFLLKDAKLGSQSVQAINDNVLACIHQMISRLKEVEDHTKV